MCHFRCPLYVCRRPAEQGYPALQLGKTGENRIHPPVYIRTTQEMLDEFSNLPRDKAIEIVVTNTRKIAEQCEVLKPLAEEWKSYNPKIAGADAKLVKMCYDNAHAIYGDPLP